MRVLCSFVGGAGHLVPQLPSAAIRAAIDELRADEAVRARVAQLRTQTLALPEAAAIVDQLEALSRGARS